MKGLDAGKNDGQTNLFEIPASFVTVLMVMQSTCPKSASGD